VTDDTIAHWLSIKQYFYRINYITLYVRKKQGNFHYSLMVSISNEKQQIALFSFQASMHNAAKYNQQGRRVEVILYFYWD
jgi:hypothetical protein